LRHADVAAWRRMRGVLAVITSHQRRLVFDNCSDRRIDNGIPRQRAFAR
jgi:hypothetical protein